MPSIELPGFITEKVKKKNPDYNKLGVNQVFVNHSRQALVQTVILFPQKKGLAFSCVSCPGPHAVFCCINSFIAGFWVFA